MELSRFGLVLLLLLVACFADPFPEVRGRKARDPDAGWKKINVRRKGPGPPHGPPSDVALPDSKRYPVFLITSSSNDHQEVFKPEVGVRDLPPAVKQMLLGAAGATTAPPPDGGQASGVQVQCHIDRIFVRVRKERVRGPIQNLKLGSCPVNKISNEHYYFLYPLKAHCGFRSKSNPDDFRVGVTLSSDPGGKVIRDVPLHVNIVCKYPRYFHSFRDGIFPKVEGGTLHKLLKQCAYIITAVDANGNQIQGNLTVPLGGMMYFEAKQAHSGGSSGTGRMYIHRCFLTTTRQPNSGPKYDVIDKGGCMMDSLVNERSGFLLSGSKSVVRFGMPAVVLGDSGSFASTRGQKLFMHCEAAAGPEHPTEGRKACTYDMREKRWKELYGDDSVCSCCDSTCIMPHHKSSDSDIVSSQSWQVDWDDGEENLEFSWEDQAHIVMGP